MAISTTQEMRSISAQHTLGQVMIHLEMTISAWLARHSLMLLQISVGILYVWFGTLKLFQGLNPVLALLEIVLGLGLLSGRFLRPTMILMLLQMGAALSLIVLQPDLVLSDFPYDLSLAAQNIILMSAALVIGVTMRGGSLTDSK